MRSVEYITISPGVNLPPKNGEESDGIVVFKAFTKGSTPQTQIKSQLYLATITPLPFLIEIKINPLVSSRKPITAGEELRKDKFNSLRLVV